MHHTAEVSEQVNRKCPSGNTILWCSTLYTYPKLPTAWTTDVGPILQIN